MVFIRFCCVRFPLGCSFVLRLDFKWLAIDDDTEKYLRLSVFLVRLLKHALGDFIVLPAKSFSVLFEQ